MRVMLTNWVICFTRKCSDSLQRPVRRSWECAEQWANCGLILRKSGTSTNRCVFVEPTTFGCIFNCLFAHAQRVLVLCMYRNPNSTDLGFEWQNTSADDPKYLSIDGDGTHMVNDLLYSSRVKFWETISETVRSE